MWWCLTEKKPHFEQCGLDVVFAAAMAAKYLIISNAHL